MKRTTYYRLSLLLPYLVLGLTAIISIPLYETVADSENWLLIALFAFTISAIIWGPLYTWVVVTLLLWGIRRSEKEIRFSLLLAPLMLAAGMGIPTAIMDVNTTGALILWNFLHSIHAEHLLPSFFPYFKTEDPMIFMVAMLMMGGICIMVGYPFVLLVLGFDRVLTRKHVLIAETE